MLLLLLLMVFLPLSENMIDIEVNDRGSRAGNLPFIELVLSARTVN